MSAPRLIVELPFEQRGRILFDCETFEDEKRLRLWLRHSEALHGLPETLERLLDDLDDIDTFWAASE
jgi:hypothetical protein